VCCHGVGRRRQLKVHLNAEVEISFWDRLLIVWTVYTVRTPFTCSNDTSNISRISLLALELLSCLSSRNFPISTCNCSVLRRNLSRPCFEAAMSDHVALQFLSNSSARRLDRLYGLYALVCCCSTVHSITLLEMTVFWGIATCSLSEVDRRFRGVYCLHHAGDEDCYYVYDHCRSVTCARQVPWMR
jgi:hypothetical protein